MRYQRFSALIGTEKMALLRNKTVLLCGLGGVGSYVFEALVRAGVGRIVVADRDVFDITNLNRQLGAMSSTVGRWKVEVAWEHAKDIDPSTIVDARKISINVATVPSLFEPFPDFVIDAIDDVDAKIALIALATTLRVKVISSMGFANRLHPELIKIASLNQTSNDPLARVMRTKLKAAGLSLALPVAFSTETPIQPQDAQTKLGSSPYVPSVAGLFIASYVINQWIEEERV